eukprot:GHVS01000826.1.p1 GENE.GHVS01000826.1~~GHVS01000826.1.p1  ORF type:complete len:220 (-),score=6.50 GHVS01000826.1:1-660(-)
MEDNEVWFSKSNDTESRFQSDLKNRWSEWIVNWLFYLIGHSLRPETKLWIGLYEQLKKTPRYSFRFNDEFDVKVLGKFLQLHPVDFSGNMLHIWISPTMFLKLADAGYLSDGGFFYGYLVTIRDPKLLVNEKFGVPAFSRSHGSDCQHTEADFEGTIGKQIAKLYFYHEVTSVKRLADSWGDMLLSSSKGSFVELTNDDSIESRFIKVLVLFNIPLLQV